MLDGVDVLVGVGIDNGKIELPQVQIRGEVLFLINNINMFNSRGQFPSYLIFINI